MNRYQAASKAIDALPILAIALFFGVFIFKSFWKTVGIVAFSYFLSWVFYKLARLSVDLQFKGDYIEFNKQINKLAQKVAESKVKQAISKSAKKRVSVQTGTSTKPTSKTTKTVAQKRPTSSSPKTA